MQSKASLRIALFLAAYVATASWVHTAALFPDVPDSLPPDIEKLYDVGRYREAADALQVAVEQKPANASLYFWLGRSFFEMRDFSQSISSLEHAVKLGPERSEYHDWLGRAYGRRAEENSRSNMVGALSMARRTHREFETAVRLDPTNVSAQRDLIAFMVNAPGDLGGGEQRALEQIHSLSDVDAVEGRLAKANLYVVQKKFDLADQEYERILESAPDRINADLEAADYYRDRGDSEHMNRAVEAAAKASPSDSRLSYYRGVALVLSNQEPKVAEEGLRTYIANVPENSELPSHASAYQWLGRLYENQKEPELAAEQYKAALALEPHNKEMREALKQVQKK